MALLNVTKKIEKAAGSLGLEPGEAVLAACTTNPSGTIKRMMARELGGVVGAALAARSGAKDGGEGPVGPTLADRFPAGRHFLALTDRRLLVASIASLSGKPRSIAAQWGRHEVAAIEVEKGRMASPVTIAFTDGSVVQVEGAAGTDPESLSTAFDRS